LRERANDIAFFGGEAAFGADEDGSGARGVQAGERLAAGFIGEDQCAVGGPVAQQRLERAPAISWR
jgi:hypothetical protein